MKLVKLTSTEAQAILDLLKEITIDDNAKDNCEEEIEQCIELLSAAIATYQAEKHS